MERERLLLETDLFVLDMDGTFYLGDRLLEGSLEFLEEVRRLNKRFLFFTNNSSQSPRNYIQKLARMGCTIREDEIMTSGDVAAVFLQRNYPKKQVYLLGTPTLEENFLENKIQLTKRKPDIVVVGFDKTLSYEKLERACTYIREGAMFVATHLDVNCPTEDGFIPDCGAICAAIEVSTGRHPRFLGKPFRDTVDMVLDRMKVERSRVSFVGDRIYTDVKAGVQNGAKGILVLSGETQLSDVAASDIKPDGIFTGLSEMAAILKTFGSAALGQDA